VNNSSTMNECQACSFMFIALVAVTEQKNKNLKA